MTNMARPMRACSIDETNIHKLRYPLIGSPKLDGIRAVSTDRGLLSKSLKPIRNRYIQSFDFPAGLDGELLIGQVGVDDTFDLTRRGVMTAGGEPDFRYMVFDYWDCDREYSIRHGVAEGFCHSDRLSFLDYYFVETYYDMLDYEKEQLALGYEGIMLRSPNGKYKFGTSTMEEQYLMKLKRFSDAEGIVVGFEEERANGNELIVNDVGLAKRSAHKDNKVGKGICGSLIVVADGFQHEFGVSGFSKALAKEMWDNQDSWLGQTITFKYQAAGSTADAPRFPKYKGIRHPEDM